MKSIPKFIPQSIVTCYNNLHSLVIITNYKRLVLIHKYICFEILLISVFFSLVLMSLCVRPQNLEKSGNKRCLWVNFTTESSTDTPKAETPFLIASLGVATTVTIWTNFLQHSFHSDGRHIVLRDSRWLVLTTVMMTFLRQLTRRASKRPH